MYYLAPNEHECKKCMCIILLWIYSSNDLGNIFETVLYQSLAIPASLSIFLKGAEFMAVIIKLTKRSHVQKKTMKLVYSMSICP
jgi:hypothetical protein